MNGPTPYTAGASEFLGKYAAYRNLQRPKQNYTVATLNVQRAIKEDPMNCFTLLAVGNLARDPERFSKGDLNYTHFLLVGNDYSRDEEGNAREFVTSLWFVAFGALGETLASHARKGDQ